MVMTSTSWVDHLNARKSETVDLYHNLNPKDLRKPRSDHIQVSESDGFNTMANGNNRLKSEKPWYENWFLMSAYTYVGC